LPEKEKDFFNIYDVNTWGKKRKRSSYHYLPEHMSVHGATLGTH
jgi:hypothetical protein